MRLGNSNNQWGLTHFYDRCLSNELLEKINPLISKASEISKEDKLSAFIELRMEILDDILALKYYDEIINDYVENNNLNYDPINNFSSIDLLYNVYLIFTKDNNNITSLLIEQLKDMQTGFCPQGRTIRLIQLIQPYL